jgi:hypothetical protein
MRLYSLKDDDFTKCCYSTKDGRKHSGILDKTRKKWKWTALDKGDRVYFTSEKKSGDECVIKGIIVAAGKKMSDVEITESCDSHYQVRNIKEIDNCLLFSRE